ncbi:MAG: hypothetical protein OQK12_06300 [Motiliproteus sp.]|nr:hypothetical protein [Motiliproteus sp.]MCW9052901.1 hypothetical protein [Motiliproteus sp.]
MDSYDAMIVARVLHVLGVVMWIGGVAFVTTVLIPALRKLPSQQQRMELFETLEGRFGKQAKIATLVTGLSGFFMLESMNAWQRYQQPEFWWIHAMTFIWVIFTLVLFVLEPLFLHRWFHRQAQKNSERSFKVLHRMHYLLLTLSLLTVLGAVSGVRGWYL